MLANRIEKPYSTTSPDAVSCYEEAIDRILGSESGAIEQLDKALQFDQDFAMAAAARYLLAKDSNDTAISDYRDNAERTAAQAKPWEQAHYEALSGLINDTLGNLDKIESYIATQPGDLLINSQLCGYLIFYGGPKKLDRVLNLLESVQGPLADDWAFQARLGFAASEAGQHERGRTQVEQALKARPQALYSIHSMAHVLHNQGAMNDSEEVIRQWLNAHGDNSKSGQLYGHVQWHLALAEWQLGNNEAAWKRYNDYCAPTTTTCGPVLTLADCGGFLLRDYLSQGNTKALNPEVLALTKNFTGMLSHPFIALHVAGIFASAGDITALKDCYAMIDEAKPSVNQTIALDLVDAITQYVQNDFESCVKSVEKITPEQRIGVGGSYVERMLIDLIEAKANQQLNT